jgi:3-oxoadipate enol-lactonase
VTGAPAAIEPTPLRSGRVAGVPALAVDACGVEPPVVVFLHGIGGNRTNWHRQLRALGSHATAIAYDARGYGDSDDYPGALRMDDFRDDLDRVLDAFDAPAAHLVGLSMGGVVALDYALHRPARVRSLVLADTGLGPAHDFPPDELERFLELRRAPLLAGATPAEIAPAVARSLVSADAVPGALAELERSLARLHRDSYLKTLDTVTRYTGLRELQRIAVSTLVLVGADDRVTPPVRVRAFAAQIPGARYAEIPGAGHLSNLEQPERFDARLLEFLSPFLRN